MATASGLDDRETYLQWRKRLDDFSESDEAPKQLSEQSRRIIAVAIVDYTLLGRALRQTIEGQRAWRRFREQLAPVMLDHLYGGYGNVREAIEMLMTFSAQVAEQQSAFVESRVGGLLLSSPDVRESEDGPNSSTNENMLRVAVVEAFILDGLNREKSYASAMQVLVGLGIDPKANSENIRKTYAKYRRRFESAPWSEGSMGRDLLKVANSYDASGP